MAKSGISCKSKGEFSFFDRGFRISCWLLFFSFASFVFWLLGQSKEYIIISNSNFFSRIFFFLNPNIFRRLFFEGNFFSYLSAAVNLESFLFLCFYLLTVVFFILTIVCAVKLFFVAYRGCIHPFHYVSCFAFFPIVSFFLIVFPILKMMVYKFEMKRHDRSRFEEMFSPETFMDFKTGDFTEKDLYDRDITKPFTKAHYDRFFSKKTGYSLRDLSEKLDNFLA